MKSDKKELIYECSYKNMRWKCRIKDIEQTKQITGFTVSGKGSLYRVYLIEFGKTRWLDIPEMGIWQKCLGSCTEHLWGRNQVVLLLWNCSIP